jgi:hypothetical protein
MHPVKGTKQGRFAATGWTDDTGDALIRNRYADVFENMVAADINIQVIRTDMGPSVDSSGARFPENRFVADKRFGTFETDHVQ